jgi:hypothetical protein
MDDGIRYMTAEDMNERSRARYDSTDHLFDPEGRVLRFPDDPEQVWRLCWNDTRLQKG